MTSNLDKILGDISFTLVRRNYYYFHRVTSAKKNGHHKNWEIKPNPDPKRSTPMYIVKQEQKDLKVLFSDELSFCIDIEFIKKK